MMEREHFRKRCMAIALTIIMLCSWGFALAEEYAGFHFFLDIPLGTTPEEFAQITKEKLGVDIEITRFKKTKTVAYAEGALQSEGLPYLRAEFRSPKTSGKAKEPGLIDAQINYDCGQAFSYYEDTPAGWSAFSISQYEILLRQLTEEYGAPTQHFFVMSEYKQKKRNIRFQIPEQQGEPDIEKLMELCESTVAFGVVAVWGNVVLELLSHDLPNRGVEGHKRAQRLHVYYRNSLQEERPIEVFPEQP